MSRGVLFVLAVLAGCGGGGPAADAGGDQSGAGACSPRVVSVALLGDSTQFGIDGDTSARVAEDPGALLQAALDARFGPGAAVVTNRGVPGARAYQAEPIEADVVVENFGINDSGPVGEPLEDYVAAVRAIGATIIETQSPVTRPSQPLARQARYAEAAAQLAAETGASVADVFGYVGALPDWPTLIGADGVHPTPALYRRIVDDVLAPAVAAQVAPLRCDPTS